MKGHAIREEMNGVAEAPGKTWFWELAAGVIDAGRCVQCGTCVAVCPSDSIGVHPESGLPELVKMCTGCSLCWDFCPRGGLRYEATWELPPSPVPLPIPRSPRPRAVASGPAPRADPFPEGPLGRVLATCSARARVRGARAQDGGVVSALLRGLLADGAIDGAVVAVPDRDARFPGRGVAALASTGLELDAAAGSFYNQTMALAGLDLRQAGLPAGAKVALVGTPCEIQGLRALQARPWPGGSGAHRVEAVVLTVALLCTKSFDYRVLMRDLLEERRGVELSQVAKVDVTAGRLRVTASDGAVVVDEPVRAFHEAALRGCEECADFAGRCADLAVGSVGSRPGWSSVVVRTPAGSRAFAAARALLEVRELEEPAALERLDAADRRGAERSLSRPLDPGGSLFIPYADHAGAAPGGSTAPGGATALYGAAVAGGADGERVLVERAG